MNSNVSDDALESLCSQFVSTVSRAIGGADPDARQPVALLDVPGHANVGDQLIYLGQLALLEAAGLDISFQCRAGQRIEQNLSRLHPEGPLLMQGGGNLGDLWPAFQLWRERVISEFHDRKIVLLPQSIQFESTSNAQRARRGFAEHPDLTLLLRDYSSLERAKTLFPETESLYCPDGSIGAAASTVQQGPAEVDALVLQRGDKESRGGWRLEGSFSQATYDWSGNTTAARTLERLSWSDNRKLNRAAGPVSHLLARRRAKAYRLGAQEVVASGAKLLSRGKVVVTDRLHAAVLARLIGRPVVALDNSYGKLSSAANAWLDELGGITLVDDATEAELAVSGLLASEQSTHRAA